MSLEPRVIDSLPSVEASLNYLVPTGDRPFRYTYAPPDGMPVDNQSYQAHRFRIHDARSVTTRVSLDEEGFALVQHRTVVRNFYDDEEVRKVSAAEVL